MKHSISALLIASVVLACNSNERSDEDYLAIYEESAFVHYEQNDLARAEAQALKGLAIDKRNVPLNLMMGWILLRQDTQQTLLRAEQVFRRLIDDDQEDHRVYLGLATTLERLAKLHEQASVAVAEGKRRTDAPDRAVRAVELAGDAHKLREESLGLYQTTLEARPKNIKALNGAMRVTAALERPKDSLVYCETMLITVDAERKFWTSLLQKENLDTNEETNLQQQVENAADLMVSACLFAAELERGLGLVESALEHLNYALEINPDLPDGYSMRAQLMAETGRLEEAVADIDRFIARSKKPYEHPDIRKAFELLTTWNRTIQESK